MNKERFLEIMEEILDTEEDLTFGTVLDELEEWDSLSRIMFLAVMSDREKKIVKPGDVKNALTISDLYKLIE